MNKPCALAFAVTLAVLAPEHLAFADQPTPPTKAEQAEAGSRFKRGTELFDEGDYQAALIEFRRAYKIAPNYAVLYNIGQVYYQLQDYANALGAFQRYLADGDKNIAASRKRDVQKEIQKLQYRVANLDITVNVPDADISVDDVTVGKSPLSKPVMVNPGRHQIAISKVGYTSTSKSVEVAGTDAPKLTFELTEQPKATPPPTSVEPPPQGNGPTAKPDVVSPPPPPPGGGGDVTPPPPARRSVPWVGWAVTGGLAVGAGVCGTIALINSNDLKTRLVTPQASRAPLEADAKNAKTFALVTDILTGAAVVAGGVSLVFTVLATSDAKSQNKPAEPKAARRELRAVSDVRLGVGPAGVSLGGAF